MLKATGLSVSNCHRLPSSIKIVIIILIVLVIVVTIIVIIYIFIITISKMIIFREGMHFLQQKRLQGVACLLQESPQNKP